MQLYNTIASGQRMIFVWKSKIGNRKIYHLWNLIWLLLLHPMFQVLPKYQQNSALQGAAPGRWILSDAWYPRAFHQSQSGTGALVSFKLSMSSFTCQAQLPQWVLNYGNNGWKKLPYSMILARCHVSSIFITSTDAKSRSGDPHLSSFNWFSPIFTITKQNV